MSRPGVTFGDMFAGAGGATAGAWMAGAEPVVVVDNDRTALETHARNLPGETVEHDLRVVNPSVLPRFMSYDGTVAHHVKGLVKPRAAVI